MGDKFSNKLGGALADKAIEMAPQMLETLLKSFPFGNLLAIGGKLLDSFLGENKDSLHPEMRIDELNKVYSLPIDSIILKTEKETGNKFVGGEFIVTYNNDSSFKCAFDLYFTNKHGEWVKKSAASNSISNQFLHADAINELATQKEIKFQIEPPTVEAENEIKSEISENMSIDFKETVLQKPVDLKKTPVQPH